MDSNPFPKSPQTTEFNGNSSNGATASMDSINDIANSGPMPGGETFAGADATMPPPSFSSASRYTSMAHDTVDKVADMASRLSDSSAKAMEQSTTMVKEKPLAAVGAALALGLLLGALISR